MWKRLSFGRRKRKHLWNLKKGRGAAVGIMSCLEIGKCYERHFVSDKWCGSDGIIESVTQFTNDPDKLFTFSDYKQSFLKASSTKTKRRPKWRNFLFALLHTFINKTFNYSEERFKHLPNYNCEKTQENFKTNFALLSPGQQKRKLSDPTLWIKYEDKRGKEILAVNLIVCAKVWAWILLARYLPSSAPCLITQFVSRGFPKSKRMFVGFSDKEVLWKYWLNKMDCLHY